MDAQTINQNYDLLTLALGDTHRRLKLHGQFYIGPCPFCGGRDRFNLKHTPHGWRWYCRHCGGEKYNTSIDYIMRRESVDFKQALESMGGDTHFRPRAAVAIPEPDITIPDPDWEKRAWRRVDVSFSFLKSVAGKFGRQYLAEREISKATIFTYLLGMHPNKYDPIRKCERPAIVIPWFDESHTITAIKYRFIDELARDPDYRYIMEGGSVPILFGLHAAAGHNVLIFVEGEINCMSITQASAQDLLRIDALSFGSQSGNRADVLKKVAQDYRRVIVWADDPERAKKIRADLNLVAATALCSPKIDGKKYDANELLQKGWLSDFLRESTNI